MVSASRFYFLKEARVLDDLKTVVPGQRYRIKSSAGAPVTGDKFATSEVLHHLPQETIVLSAGLAGC